MVSIGECRCFHRTPTFDHLTRRSNSNSIKFKRAFQFLQLLLLQRVYGIDVISNVSSCSLSRRQSKQQQQQHNFQVFLGGSCNPTTWRHDQAIPYFQSRSVSFFNPQVSDWTPDLVEIEHRAKELAPLLFFVIDPETRSLASIIEVCYLAALGRSIIVVMNPLPEREHTKFIQNKKTSNKQEDEEDYGNVVEARRILLILLRSINVPIFDNVQLALECAAFILETTNRTVVRSTAIDENDSEHNEDLPDNPYPTPPSSADIESERSRPLSVVVKRSISNEKSFEWPEEFYRQMYQPVPFSPPIRRHSNETSPLEEQPSTDSPFRRSLFLTVGNHARQTIVCPARTQLSCSTTESDDDGFYSLSSSDRALSDSTSSISSESFECCIDHPREDGGYFGSTNPSSTSLINNLISTFSPYVPFFSSSSSTETSVSQSLFVLCTLPFRFIKNTLLSPILPSAPSAATTTTTTTVTSPSQESVLFDSPCPTSPPPPSFSHLFDLYIASGEYDQCWLNTYAIPLLDEAGVTYIKRQSYQEDDQLDATYDIHLRKQSRLLYYLINDSERLSHLTSELAFLIGERKHHIIVCLQGTISEEISMSPCERRDIQRSRKYLEDLAQKENITLCHSRAKSWEHVLAYFLPNN